MPFVSVRISQDELDQWKASATAAALSLSDFIRETVRDKLAVPIAKDSLTQILDRLDRLEARLSWASQEDARTVVREPDPVLEAKLDDFMRQVEDFAEGPTEATPDLGYLAAFNDEDSY